MRSEPPSAPEPTLTATASEAPKAEPIASVKPERAAPAVQTDAKPERAAPAVHADAKPERAAAPKASPRQPSSEAKPAAPSQTRSAILPIGLATAGLAGLLIWLGSGGDEQPSATSEPPANVAPARPETPGTPEIRALAPAAQPTPAEPALAAPVNTAEAVATPSAAVTASAAEPSAAAPSAAAPSAAAPSAAAPSALASAAEPTRAAAPAAPAGAEAGAEAPPPGSTPSTAEPFPSDEGLTAGPITTVYMEPDCAVLYRRGKRVGRSGVRVMIPEGNKRHFEVVCPGHGTRKLILDGTAKEVMVGLRPKK